MNCTTKGIDAIKALEWLKEGNLAYISSNSNHKGDISKEKRLHTHHHGQNPYAIIITCSDSRVIPEAIFMQGIGDLFVIRLAGNVLADFGLGSVEYGIEHLGCKLVLVLGHTKCGAVASALEGEHTSYVGSIVMEIKKAIGTTKSPLLATKLNVKNTIAKINNAILTDEMKKDGVKVVGAIYHTQSGEVEFLEEN